MPGSPAAYHEIVRGGEVAPIGLVPPRQAGGIKFGKVFISLGAPSQVDDVSLTIIRQNGTPKPNFNDRIVRVRPGRREVFELGGGGNFDTLAVVDMSNVPPGGEVAVLVEWDSP